MEQREIGAVVRFPPLEQVVAADVVLVAERDEARHPDAQPSQPLQQRDPHATALHRDPGAAGPGKGAAELGVQPDGRIGLGHAQTVRPDQAHAVPAAGPHQPAGLLRPEAGGEHHQGPDSDGPALLGRPGDGAGGHGQHGEVRHGGQRADGRIGGLAVDLPGVRVHRPDRARETAPPDLPEDGAPHRARPPGGPDHRDGGRAQQRRQTRDVGAAAALVHGRAVALVALVQRHPDPHLALCVAALDRQPEVGEDLVDGPVAEQGVGLEEADAGRPGGVHQVFQQQGGHAPAVPVVGHRERQLRRLRRIVQQLAVRLTHQFLPHPGPQRQKAGPRRPAQSVCGLRGRVAADPEEPHPTALLGHPGRVQIEHRPVIVRAEPTDLDGGAVGQQGLGGGVRLVDGGHGGSPRPSPFYPSSLRSRPSPREGRPAPPAPPNGTPPARARSGPRRRTPAPLGGSPSSEPLHAYRCPIGVASGPAARCADWEAGRSVRRIARWQRTPQRGIRSCRTRGPSATRASPRTRRGCGRRCARSATAMWSAVVRRPSRSPTESTTRGRTWPAATTARSRRSRGGW